MTLLVAFEICNPSRATWPEVVSTIMDFEGGRWAVLITGVIIISVGIGQMGRGFGRIFLDEFEGNPPQWVGWFGMVGYAMLGLSLVVVGALFSWAAFAANPEYAGTMNNAMHFLFHQPMGSLLLSVVAAGFICFALFCIAWSFRPFHIKSS